MKKLLAIVLAIVLLAALTTPMAVASTVTVEALNPLGAIDIQQNIPLTSRDRFLDNDGNVDFNDRVIGLSAYSKTHNSQVIQALGWLLMERYPGVLIVNTGVADLGSPWNHKTDANYDQWAGIAPLPANAVTLDGISVAGRTLDAVIFGVAD
ncbi:MAG: hypothetical protein FWC66_08375 [Oscillospiraceae bacterium]|nr:hypothetical protein [Oscillospiraceae bacterium]